jgi:uncharacterized 2Fe-2S/4Fe-4S cluster protein (DUF4445 family)
VCVDVPTGTLIADAAHQAGLELNIPCGGQGRCGRCAVIVDSRSSVRSRSEVRLSEADLAAGYVLACQTVVEGPVTVTIPPQDKVERRLVTDRTAAGYTLPFAYDPAQHQPMHLVPVVLSPPTMEDQTDDWSRLRRTLAMEHGIVNPSIDLATLRKLGQTLRDADWTVTCVVEQDTWDRPEGPARLVDVLPGHAVDQLWGAAVDIGTTTVSLLLVDLVSGRIAARAAEYNAQIRRGEDVISRIIYASRNGCLEEMQTLVVGTINELLERAAGRAGVRPADVYKLTVAGNSTMIHLFLGVPANSIRLDPFVTAVNQPPPVRAGELGLAVHPQATVDCLPGVASYVGADIPAGVLGSQMCSSSAVTLFLDVGTNGEMVLGDCDWLISCACSAGPAFEGAGVQDGMRATVGAIEEVWISSETYEPTYRVIPDPKLEAQGLPTPPRGLCGSGLISLLAEMLVTGVMDKGGNLNFDLGSPRIRRGDHGPEYVIAWANETAHGRDIVFTKVDIDNLIRAKAAIYAGFTVMARSVGTDLSSVERVLIGGSFGQYINVEKAIQIGLLPDLPWEKFHFLGNTSLKGALLALMNREFRHDLTAIAQKMTYVELSADNAFYDAFTSALFLPHTDLSLFPSVAEVLTSRRNGH